ncbi:IS110 family RNA-guided transposase [Anaerocolumna chitinilytica]|uniref:IS110 family transposase n=1 Tax=Anaerocolumna chitinilytica TaxID=1727145 RepID=A0A7I8DT46_9FIRM|nr:IS110 family transposase [Anaerocolumna chitinilytica]BCJ97491.1 IS110 family transposase [Anaerocolumna chitinilytica]BCJ99466.1 IS110 family transposase [Anaerocolumna chitinilytica]BCJ99580.1 IS110 family transposase [Anaerocolumna chitinilytica]
MMRLVYPICCGLDVHKNVIVATIVTTDKNGISEYNQKSFSTINSDIQKFHDWLIKNDCFYVCMESTGKYWIPIFNYLENDINVCLTHPKYVKAIKGKKTDKKDSRWIADLYKFDLVRCSFIPPKNFRQLRELARYRFKLVCMKSSEKNRIQNCMTVSNIGIASILSDPFGKTATEIMTYLLSNTTDTINDKAVRKLIKKNAKVKSDDIIEAIKGYNIETDQAKKLELARGHLDYLDDMITQTEVELYIRIKPYYEFVEYISSLPGITEISATIILAEIGIDMSIFDDAKHLCSWCGLSPSNNESAGKKKSVRIAKAGAYLKPMMVQCALAAIKSKKQPYFAIKYGRIKKRRGHKKAIIAIARMMMVCIYHMISEKQPFNPTDYEELMDPHYSTSMVTLNDENVFAYLEAKGYDLSLLVKCNDN